MNMTNFRIVVALLFFLVSFLPVHASAWAGQGWYLMLPPVKNEQILSMTKLPAADKIYDVKAPLSKWRQDTPSFDTAAQCEKTRNENLAFVRDLLDKTEKHLHEIFLRKQGPEKEDDIKWWQTINRV